MMNCVRSARLSVLRSASGFSLIELLVVMFIIGLLFGVVTLAVNVGSEPEEQLEQETRRLLEYSRLAEDRAVLTGEPVGLVLMPPELESAWQYQWQRYRGGRWVEADEPLSDRQLPEGIEISLEVEGEHVDLTRMERDEEELPEPSIIFFPGGEITPFELTLFDAQSVEEQQVLSSRRIGRVEIIDPDEPFL